VHTVVPRLTALGADLEQVRFGVNMHDGIEKSILLPNDVGLLTELVEQHDARLIVVDPLMAYLPGQVNTWMDQGVRLALAPLHHLAEASRAAILVVGHLNKAQGTDPLQRIGGSIGIPAAARSVLLLGRDPGDQEGERGSRRILAHIKSNLGLPAPSLAFEIEEWTIAGGTRTAVIVPRGASRYTGTELLAQQGPQRESRFAQAVAFLEAELAEGPKLVAELTEKAGDLAISSSTLERARRHLGALSEKVGLEAGWQWELPDASGASEGL
jgi:hypothetical protein